MLDEIIGLRRLRFSADVASIQIQLPGWPIACPRHSECQLHWIAMSSSNSLQKPGRNTSSFRNTDHFGFGGRSNRERRTTLGRSSSRPPPGRAATGYGSATASDLSGGKTDNKHYHAGITTASTAAVLNSRFYETVAGVSLC
jgi:hypothetical protein